MGFFDKFFQDMLNGINKVSSGIVDSINQVSKAVSQVSDILGSVSDAVTKGVSAVASGASEAVSGIAGGISETVINVSGSLGGVMNKIIGGIATAADGISKAVSGISDAVSNGVKQAASSVPALDLRNPSPSAPVGQGSGTAPAEQNLAAPANQNVLADVNKTLGKDMFNTATAAADLAKDFVGHTLSAVQAHAAGASSHDPLALAASSAARGSVFAAGNDSSVHTAAQGGAGHALFVPQQQTVAS